MCDSRLWSNGGGERAGLHPIMLISIQQGFSISADNEERMVKQNVTVLVIAITIAKRTTMRFEDSAVNYRRVGTCHRLSAAEAWLDPWL